MSDCDEANAIARLTCDVRSGFAITISVKGGMW